MLLKRYFKLIIYCTIGCILIFIIKNLGYYFDITTKPIKSDIIICLGGGENGNRITKAISLLKNNYSNYNKLLVTSNNKKDILKKSELLKKHQIYNVIATYNTLNTMEELLFIKKIIIKNNYKSVSIITTNPHSRRISLFIKYFINTKEFSLTYRIIGTNPKWWNKENYYKNKKAVFFVLKESLKIIYNFCYYTLNKYYDFNEETINSLYQIKKYVINHLNHIQNLLN